MNMTKILLTGLLLLLLIVAIVIGLAWAPDRPVDTLKTRWAAAPSRFIELQGMQVHLRDEGPRDDPEPIVLIHGTSASLHTWDGWTAALKAERRVIRMDLPGFGLTGPAPDGDYRMERYADFIVALMDQLGVRQAVLAGNSLGGGIAWRTAVQHPDRVSRLILAGTSSAFGRGGGARAAGTWARRFVAQRTAPLDAGRTMQELAQTLVPQMVGPGALPEGVRLAEHCMGGVPAATWRRALDCLVTFDRQAALALVRVPTLLIGGEFDRVAAPSVMRAMASAIAGARYAELKGIGHLMNLEAPEDFDGLVLDFLAEQAPALPGGLH